ncbi:MAG: HmuY family protein [Reichenbachiella sp.]|uniref:HmuY family protein n=1 Tax=Reichenbachiella sp. TaxID=2184521 RepID=UPI003266C85A
MKYSITNSILLAGLLLLGISACEEEESAPIRVNFANEEVNLAENDASVAVEISFSRPVAADGSISIDLSSTTLTYGESADFYTLPTASDLTVTIPYTAGDESVVMEVFPGAGLNIEQSESLVLSLPANEALELGSQSEMTVVFSENFIAQSGTIELNAGGASFGLQAFVDLSKNKQTNVEKYSWDLGFASEPDEFKVILNSGAYVMARRLDLTDLTQVNAEDTVGFGSEMAIPQYDPSIGAADWVDAPNGDLSDLAIGTVASTDSENQIFIVKRDGEGRNWKKIRIIRADNGYQIEYADIDSDQISIADITKEDAYNFTFFDLDEGITDVQPEKESWDIQYGTYTNLVNFGGFIPYGYSDFITLNRYQTQVAKVLISDISYADITAEDLSNLTFSSEINALGSDWRIGGGPGTEPALYDDRFFVILDAQNNYYKLKFNRLTSSSGERGYPELTYELITP